jgi:hypothetical protein
MLGSILIFGLSMDFFEVWVGRIQASVAISVTLKLANTIIKPFHQALQHPKGVKLINIPKICYNYPLLFTEILLNGNACALYMEALNLQPLVVIF